MKILYVTTISNTINAFLVPHIKALIKQGHQVDIACNINQDVNPEIVKLGCSIYNIEFSRSPISFNNYHAYKKLLKLIILEKYNIIHTHTPIASVCVRLAKRKVKGLKVIYTAHGFHFFKGAPLKNWLIYYPIEKWLSKYTDVLITINNEDFLRAKKSFNARKVHIIPGIGLDVKKLEEVDIDYQKKRSEFGVDKTTFVLLTVGELNSNKNQETIIKSLSKLEDSNIKLLICGEGPLKYYLEKLAKELGVDKQVKLLGYRKDIPEICKVSDLFMFPSKREGLGMAALEAMACGLPIITSNIHGITDYSINGITGYVCDPNDINKFAESIRDLKNNAKLREKIRRENIKRVKKYDLENSIRIMSNIYKEEI
ncbi:glycosyltransferase family 4 protein [Peribacillus frigoritolerans]|uniref:Glycosyltransferase family 4 protein n=1 Tax=Peribacillus frigoritolerans TaxID=450367 RepID=A0AAJ1QR23_9BACI|nr:glycosyltransferase family 4 protein [Peribacillus frigoritolerans]MDM5285514.1 glycosyltransferase family 4 protein [Peribacillus frigoritolerans]